MLMPQISRRNKTQYIFLENYFVVDDIFLKNLSMRSVQ